MAPSVDSIARSKLILVEYNVVVGAISGRKNNTTTVVNKATYVGAMYTDDLIKMYTLLQ